MGISAGATMVRAIKSATNSILAPNKAHPGSKKRWSGPNLSRRRCGTTKPMNPIMPATATQAPTARATCSRISFFIFSISKPKWLASCSPSKIALRGFANLIKIIKDQAMNGVTPIKLFHVDPPKLPKLQNVKLRNWASSATNVNIPVIAPAIAFMAIPASNIV